MKLIKHRETEYDFELHWPEGTVCPIKDLHSQVLSGITDGRGTTQYFEGLAYPVVINSGDGGTTVYFKHYHPIT